MDDELYKSAEEIFGDEKDKPLTVNNSNKNITVNGKTVSPKTEEEVFALELSKKLNDDKSYKYFLLLSQNNKIDRLREALAYTLLADKEGKIRVNKSVYFIAIIKRWGLRANFKNDD